MPLEISFREDLIIYLKEFNPKLKGRTVLHNLYCGNSFQQLALFQS